ncbi:hypothetical protein Patl1_25484 [Pistacia atlantica]|uniref:Uncharacterized protein n=1 Tax=Pistacia atlantica TaxID=434234 RepID=A0ACC1B034_9ROSI|nr:hypothetical protein Patl1_25484 [Pistacia atlantica]
MSPGTNSKQDYIPAVKLYSLRFDTWRNIDGFPFEIHHIESSKFVIEAVTWGVLRSNDNSRSLVSLYIAKEMFLELPQPNYGDRAFGPMLRILEGCVSVHLPYSPELGPFEEPKTLCFLKYTGMLMFLGRTLIMYDFERKSFQYPLIYGVQDCYETETFVESIVSPKDYQGIDSSMQI